MVATAKLLLMALAMYATDISGQSYPDVHAKVGDAVMLHWRLPDLSGLTSLAIFLDTNNSKLLTLDPATNTVTKNSFDEGRLRFLGDVRKRNVTLSIQPVAEVDAGLYTCGRLSPEFPLIRCGQRLNVTG